MKSIYLRILLLIFSLSWALIARSQQFVPIISHYTSFDYRMGMQNWSCTQDGDGIMFFGNNNGLLSFDGYEWQSILLPSRGIARSVFADGKRVYIGSYTDFGYFKRDSIGAMRYTSLLPKNFKSRNEEIWNILKDGRGRIWFQSFASFFCYDGKKVSTYFYNDSLPLWFFSVRGEIYAQIINGDVCRVDNGRFVSVVGRKDLADDHVMSMHAFGKDAVVLGTCRHGLYIMRGGQVQPLVTSADAILRQGIINRSVMISPSVIVVGTIKNGVVAINLNTGAQLWHYDKQHGLGNNTVLGLYHDRGGNVWVALDNGISLIHTGLPITVSRMDGIGMVYGMATVGNMAYLATNQALWQCNLSTGTRAQVPGCEDQNWHVERIGGKIYVGNNFSMKVVDGLTATDLTIPNMGMGSTAVHEYNLFGQRALIESTYTTFRLYRDTGSGWQFVSEIKGFSAPVREFEIDSRGVIWASHMSKGMYQLELSRDLKQFTAVKYYPSLDKGAEQMFHIINIRGRVAFAYGGKLYTYDDIRKQVLPYEALGRYGENGVLSSAFVDKNTFWLSDGDGFWLMQSSGQTFKPKEFVSNTIFGQECNIYGKSMFVDGQYAYFFLNDALGRYDMRSQGCKAVKYVPRIASVTTRDADNGIAQLPIEGDCKVSGNITVRVSYPNYDNDRLLFVYSLEGGGKTVKETSSSPTITYSNFSYGDYTLSVSICSVDGVSLGTVKYEFRYPTPFFKSVWAWIIYVAAAFALTYYFIRWRTAKVVARNKKVAERELMQQKMKVLEQERIIAEQQKVILENELSVKGKDVASMALDMVAMKNSMESVREQLLEGMRHGTITSKNANRILQQLKEGDSELFWSTYHNNFDLIHKRFFRNLHEQYPELTSNDLKICALLRLNLNTKDIASFTHLSVRGVEGARYRIRKKLGIPSDKSLTDFLLEF